MKGIITDQILRYNEVLDQLLSVVTADGGRILPGFCSLWENWLFTMMWVTGISAA